MTPSDDSLLHSILSLRLPEASLRALLDDYLELLASLRGQNAFAKRIETESGFSAQAISEIEASMLASALMLSLDKDTDFSALMAAAFPKPTDPDLSALRREIVSRAISESKEIPALAGIPLSLVRKRQADFCA